MRTMSIALAGLVLAGCAASATAPSPHAKKELAPTGELRVAVLTSNPIISATTPPIARELAAQAGVAPKLLEYAAINRLREDASKDAWDVAVVAIDPGRRSLVDFAPPHLAADGFLTVLVPPGSSARTMADMDQPGKRIAAVRGAAPLMILQRTLKSATTVAAENEDAAFALMQDGKADGYAQNRFMLRARAATLPGSRLLDDAFSGLQLAFAVPKNRPAAAEYVAGFVREAKASGAVQRAVDSTGMAGEVKVAP